MIQFDNVCFAYEGVTALDHISFSVEPGESLCLLGPNGCGKSTLLKLLNGLIFPTEGIYSFDGDAITKKRMKNSKTAKKFHQRMGFVFQDSEAQLFCSTVYDEIAFGPRQMGLKEEETEKRVDDVLAMLEMQDFKHRQPYHLSGGEKKKVAIAATLALNPEVLVLDEPMNGLDPRTEHWLTDFLINLNQNGKTVITSTHDLVLARRISSRALLFSPDHTLAADLPTADLLKDRSLLEKVELVDAEDETWGGAKLAGFLGEKD
ncbi:MAG: ABC transporter ATP-binding protein [Acutalibacteraceae bacterium]|nr:ABC transporter ATP-binding protein [Acutalibacteraceae bacterium]